MEDNGQCSKEALSDKQWKELKILLIFIGITILVLFSGMIYTNIKQTIVEWNKAKSLFVASAIDVMNEYCNQVGDGSTIIDGYNIICTEHHWFILNNETGIADGDRRLVLPDFNVYDYTTFVKVVSKIDELVHK